MPTDPITGELIWNALIGEPAFAAQVPEDAHGVWEEVCHAVVPIVEPHLGSPVDVETFLRVKFDMLTFMLDGEWTNRIIVAMTGEGLFSTMAEMAIGMLRSSLPQFEEILGNADAFLAAQGITLEQFLAHESGGRFEQTTLERWQEGGMTIRDLLLTQPSALFRND